ncbi:PREDICTED: ras-related protein Rab-28-like [Nicrophorus vespilloides]|uniref:Ras-related protein Rab-28-like n=1 Tax=Nicrophorus vespilloides TaxID=110193 RepID=A0ABM1MTN2_NICVS|nr:PREDICTED: ras-related protein Rab-28-like [Nicrophorus vespilloides]
MSDSEADEDVATAAAPTAAKEIRVAFVGEPSVGKTSLIRRLCYDEFSRQYVATVGADFYMKRISLPGRKEVTLKLTDVGGLELRGSMIDKYLFNADMIILVYDITNPTSFDYMSNWLAIVLGLLESAPFFAVIGNKCDLEHQRAVRLDKTNQFVADHNLISLLASAKTGESVDACIVDLISRHLGLPPLTKTQKEQHQAVLKVELVPSPPENVKRKIGHVHHTKSSVCCIQ